ncbi:MAG: GNAT family N-acetyltransferase [Candidatus Nanoarchaeia archaeon]|nr:GNAT family N-acetyltransferase [Candidatus Nanoarchaeia archaeon]
MTAIPLKYVKKFYLADGHKTLLKNFSCGSKDWEEELNIYLREKALSDQNIGLSKTHLFFYGDELIGYVSLANDSLQIYEKNKNGKDYKVPEEVAEWCKEHKKPYSTLPASKVCRMGSSEKYQKRKGAKIYGVGPLMLAYSALIAIDNQDSGCVFLTVDSYPEARKFYEKFGFKEVPVKDGQERKEDDNIPMFVLIKDFIKKVRPYLNTD